MMSGDQEEEVAVANPSPGLPKRSGSHSPLIGKGSTKKVEKFYERQNSLLENFENDSKKIQVRLRSSEFVQSFQRHRERLKSSTTEMEIEENADIEDGLQNGKLREAQPLARYRSSNPRVTLKEL